MLVVSMNSKRQRRPNVRFGEIGDISASFACRFSQKTEENLGPKSWKYDSLNPKESKTTLFSGVSRVISSNLTDLDPEVPPRILADLQQNRENKNPNSSKPVHELVSSNKINTTQLKLDFSNITRKCRATKRRARSTISNKNLVSGAWSSKITPEFSCEEGQAFDEKEFVPFTSDACSNYSSDCIKDISDQVTPATSKEACEHDVYGLTYDTWQQANFHACQEEDFYDGGNNLFPKSDGVWNELRGGDSEVNSVKRWLEKLGFGKYAAVFEMHEVDEEVLPLLTLEDLKEMGVFAVGTRRKLYNAIQQLRGGYSSAELIE